MVGYYLTSIDLISGNNVPFRKHLYLYVEIFSVNCLYQLGIYVDKLVNPLKNPNNMEEKVFFLNMYFLKE